MTLVEAIVIPKQPPGQDGVADVWLRGDINALEEFRLIHKDTSITETEIKRSEYSPGLIRFNNQNLPSQIPVIMQVEVTTKDSIKHHDWPHGGVYFR
jgi:hypothetical protein